MKIIFKITVIFILLLFANLIYYVFIGQENSTKKLTQGKELNLYECVSIYQMHCAVWMFGWFLSPEAAEQALLMTFPHKHCVKRNNDFFTKSKMLYAFPIENGCRVLNYPLNTITSTYDVKELRYALALDGGLYQMLDDPYLETCTVKAEYSKYIGIYKIGPIKLKLNWTLLCYIQDKELIYPFNITYFAWH